MRRSRNSTSFQSVGSAGKMRIGPGKRWQGAGAGAAGAARPLALVRFATAAERQQADALRDRIQRIVDTAAEGWAVLRRRYQLGAN